MTLPTFQPSIPWRRYGEKTLTYLEWSLYEEDISESSRHPRRTAYTAIREVTRGFEIVSLDWHSRSPLWGDDFRALVDMNFPTRETINSPFPLVQESLRPLREAYAKETI